MGRLSQIKARTDLQHFGVVLCDPKNSFNVGGAIRATGAFGGSYFVAEGRRWEEKGGSWRHMDTEGAHIRLPVYLGVQSFLPFVPYGSKVVAVEFTDDAVSLPEFVHPQVATYVFGPEDGALGDIGAMHKVYIPTEYSLNLYSAVSVVLYDREAKRAKAEEKPSEIVVRCSWCAASHYRVIDKGVGVQPVYHCNACGYEWIRLESPVTTIGYKT